MRRQPLYIGDGDDACFAWLHVDEAADPRDCCAVLCAPTGHEYTRAHRTLRHLADRLARGGVPALRFDYHGIGDSPGGDLDPARVDRWLDNIRAAVAKARVLGVARDDTAPDMTLNERLGASGIDNAYYRAPGWAGMMAEHQFTVVPDEALDHIVEWVQCHSRQGGAPAPIAQAPSTVVHFDFERAPITESACLFGREDHLFGILSQGHGGKDRPAIVMCNAGSVHHVGPNRIYVTLARHLASAGYDSLRFDLESLGDSVLRKPGRENYPYPHTATSDTRAAIELLKSRGYRRFSVLGLCSGAHTTFHTGLELHDDPIEELILINPMSFYWKEGSSLDTSRRYEDAAAYKRSARDPSRWLKLLRGEVNMKRLLEVIIAEARDKLRFREDPRLAGDLRRLQGLNRAVTFFIAEGDPGRDILMAGAPRTARRALKRGNMRLEMIPDADHTFSQFKPRKDLLGRLNAHLARRTGSASQGPG